MIFDLDPSGDEFSWVVSAARSLQAKRSGNPEKSELARSVLTGRTLEEIAQSRATRKKRSATH